LGLDVETPGDGRPAAIQSGRRGCVSLFDGFGEVAGQVDYGAVKLPLYPAYLLGGE